MSALVNHELSAAASAEVLPAVSETATVLSMIERIIRDPKIDMDRVERAMQLHKDMREQKAQEAFNIGMANVQAELPQVRRDALNDHTRSKYARLETISAAVDPIITRHGMSLSFGTEDSPLKDHYRVVCDVSLGAHTKRYHLDMPSDGVGSKGASNKTAVQAAGSTLSYARRYLKLMIFDISLTNEDNDGNDVREVQQARQQEPRRDQQSRTAPEEACITSEQVEQLRAAIRFAGISEDYVLRAGKLAALSDIWKTNFSAALTFIKDAGASNARR